MSKSYADRSGVAEIPAEPNTSNLWMKAADLSDDRKRFI
jgi:hypothetical protein